MNDVPNYVSMTTSKTVLTYLILFFLDNEKDFQFITDKAHSELNDIINV